MMTRYILFVFQMYPYKLEYNIMQVLFIFINIKINQTLLTNVDLDLNNMSTHKVFDPKFWLNDPTSEIKV